MVVVLTNGEELEEMGQGPGGTNLSIRMVSKIVKNDSLKGHDGYELALDQYCYSRRSNMVP